nr:putative reverse transcriptase domain-containing protein [Tanacetum cinerariifolium]
EELEASKDANRDSFISRTGMILQAIYHKLLEDWKTSYPVVSKEKKFEWVDEQKNAFHVVGKSIKARILEAQSEASKGVNIPSEMLKGLEKQFERKEDGGLYLAERIWVPVYGNLRALIMNKDFWKSVILRKFQAPFTGMTELVSRSKVIKNQVCTIPVIILVIPEVPIAPDDPIVSLEVGAVSVISPTGVLNLVDYSSFFDSDPSVDSLPVAPTLPLVSPFLCFDDSKVDTESEPAKIRQWPVILVRPGEAVPLGRPYRTYPDGPHKLLTARKRVGPFPARRLAWRRVMAAFVISISSDSSEESVGSYSLRVILFSTIPVIILVIPEVPVAPDDPIVALEVGAVSVISPTGVLDLVDYSSFSDSDPSVDSLPVAPTLPLVSPFLCSDDSKVDTESEPAKIRQWPVILVRPGEAVPLGRPYRTYPDGPHKLLTARKRVGPFPARRLAWRRVSHRSSDHHSSPDFTSDSSTSSLSSDSSSDISSGSSLDSLSDALSVHSSGQSHSGPSTRVVSPRLVDPSSSLYSSSERSLDSSSPSVGPSHKRCRFPTTLVPSSTLVSRLIAPALADLPPCKWFRDSYSSEVSGEEHIEMGTADAETVADLGISEEVGAHTEDGIDLGVEVATCDIREDEEEFKAETSRRGTMEIVVDPLATGDIFEPTRGDASDLEEAGQLVASRERAGLDDRVRSLGRENLKVRKDRDDTRRRLRRLESLVERCFGFCRRTMTITRSGMTPEAIEELVIRRVEEALAAYELIRTFATSTVPVLDSSCSFSNYLRTDEGNFS